MSEFATLSLIIENQAGNSLIPDKKNSGSLIYRFHKKFDRIIFSSKDCYDIEKDIYPLIKNVPRIQLNSVVFENTDKPYGDFADRIKRIELDIIINLGSKLLHDQILEIPRYGVWSYSMDNFVKDEMVFTGYNEVVTGNP